MSHKQAKYRNKKPTYENQVWDSTKELEYYKALQWMKKAGEIKDIEKQVVIPLIVNEKLVCKYVIDFVVTYPNGEKKYIEVKGFQTKDWKIKYKLFRALFPDLNSEVKN